MVEAVTRMMKNCSIFLKSTHLVNLHTFTDHCGSDRPTHNKRAQLKNSVRQWLDTHFSSKDTIIMY